MASSFISIKEEFNRILKDRAYSCSQTEMQKLLKTHGNDLEKLLIIKSGVDLRLKHEDSGSYCESASSGYYPNVQKRKMVEDKIFELGADAFPSERPAQAANDELLAAVRELAATVKQLDQKLNNLSKGGKPGL